MHSLLNYHEGNTPRDHPDQEMESSRIPEAPGAPLPHHQLIVSAPDKHRNQVKIACSQSPTLNQSAVHTILEASPAPGLEN